MKSLSDILYWLDDLIWGLPMIIILVGTGIYLTVRFRFIYQRKVIFHFKNTYGKMFQKSEGEGTVSGFAGFRLCGRMYGTCQYHWYRQYQRCGDCHCQRWSWSAVLDVGFSLFWNVHKGK